MKLKILKKAKIVITIFIFYFSLNSYSQNSEWVVPDNVSYIENPYANDAKALEKGKKIYEKLCTSCHGELGKGDGPASITLNPKPADHQSDIVQMQSDGAIYWKLSTGKGLMSPYKDLLSKTERWQLVTYIRKLGESN